LLEENESFSRSST